MMKKIMSLLFAGILCVSMFAGCGSENSNVATKMDEKPRIATKINDKREFVMTPEEFRDQFNAAKLSGIDDLDSFVTDKVNGQPSHQGVFFDIEETLDLALLLNPSKGTVSTINITLYNRDNRSKKEFKTFIKYIKSLIRWSDVTVDTEGMKTYVEKLGLDDINTNDKLYKNPKTGISMYYRMLGKNLIFCLSAN